METARKPTATKRLKQMWNKIKQGNPKYDEMTLIEVVFEQIIKYYREKIILKERVIKQQYQVLDDYRGKMQSIELGIDRTNAKNEHLIKLLILSAEYGYNYHVDTSFPDKDFESNCMNNYLQFLSGSFGFDIELLQEMKTEYQKNKNKN